MNKHWLLILLLSSCTVFISAGITRVEYFFDTDPGEGLAAPLSFTGSDVAEVAASISTTNLSNGLHFLYVRSQDALGKWSQLNPKPIIKESSSAAVISRLEYFLDNDPGPGLGTALAITPGQEVVYTGDLTLSGVSSGLHFLFIRSQNSQGFWSMLAAKTVLVTPDTAPVLARAEWYFTGAGANPAQVFTHPFTNPQTDLSDAFNVSVAHLEQDGEYQLHFCTVNAFGQKSLEEIFPFTVNFTPQNVQLTFNGTLVTVSWDAIPGADHYRLRVRPGPNAAGIDINLNDTEYTEAQDVSKMYDVTAVRE